METITTNIFYVYKHTWENTNYIYIGKGSGNRYKSTKRNSFWEKVTAKYGNPTISFLFVNLQEKESFELEIKMIKKFKEEKYTLINYSEGGEGPAGYKHTEEAKRKIGESSKLRRPSELVRKKISDSKTGSKNWMFGRKHKAERLKLLSEVNSGTRNANHNSIIYTFYNKETGVKETCTQYDLRIKYKLRSSGISSVCSGTKKSCKGWYLEGTSIISKKADSKIYTFYNKEKDITFKGTRAELIDNNDIDSVSVSRIVNRSRKSAKGWIVL